MSRKLHLTQGDLTFAESEPFALECGGSLSTVRVRYALYGEPNEAGDNVILLCHALSGSARVDQWWSELFASGAPLADDRWCVVCTNLLGSCYGSSGPRSINPATGTPYGRDFPLVTIGDTVRAQAWVLDSLGIHRLRAVIGASIGGMQALEWAIRYPGRARDCVAIGAAPLSALGLAQNHLQRQVIGASAAAPEGMRIARALAMCTYKSPELFNERHGRRPNRSGEAPWHSSDGLFDIAGYLDHQGAIFEDRFDPDSYVAITRAMDLWDPERLDESVWESVEARVTLVGISSDCLFPATDVRALAGRLRNSGVDCSYREIHSAHGHDSFLAEPEHISNLLHTLLNHEPGQATAVGAYHTEEDHSGTTC